MDNGVLLDWDSDWALFLNWVGNGCAKKIEDCRNSAHVSVLIEHWRTNIV